MNKNLKQIIRFCVVGGTAFLIEFGVFWLCTHLFGINYLISNCIAFSISVIYNYILSILWVFDTRKQNKVVEMVIFIALSIVGLGINELILWLAVDFMGIGYLIAKVAATAIVTIYNFISRKLILEKRTQA